MSSSLGSRRSKEKDLMRRQHSRRSLHGVEYAYKGLVILLALYVDLAEGLGGFFEDTVIRLASRYIISGEYLKKRRSCPRSVPTR